MDKTKNSDPDIFQLILFVWEKKKTILAFVVLAQLVALYAFWKAPVRYSSRTLFTFKTGSVESPLSNIAALVGAKTAGKGQSDISAYFDIIIFTDDFLGRILEKKWDVGGDSVTLSEFWKIPPELESPEDSYRALRKMTSVIKSGKYIQFQKDIRPSLVEISTHFENPEITYQVNLYIVSLLNEYLLMNNKSHASENRKFIELRLEEVGAELKRNEDNYLAFLVSNKSVTSPALFLESQRRKRAVDISQEIFLQLKKELELAKIDERKETPLIEVVSKPEFPLGLESRLGVRTYVLITLVGAVFGIFFALIWHFLAEAWRNRQAQ